MIVSAKYRHRSARIRRSNAFIYSMRGLLLFVMFSAPIALSFYRSQEQTSDFSVTAGKPGSTADKFGSNAGSGTAAAPGSAEAEARFFEKGVGQVLFSSRDGENCRVVLFDNQSGAFREGGEVYCGQTAPDMLTNGFGRVMKVVNSFKR